MVRRIVQVVAAGVVALALGAVASAGIVAQGTEHSGLPRVNGQDQLVLSATRLSTAFVIGYWPHPNAASTPVQASWSVACQNPGNSRSGTVTLTSGSRSAVIWTGSRSIASPWFGWDTCSVAVTLRAKLPNDSAFVAWLVSHDGS